MTDYTLVETVSTRIPNQSRQIRGGPHSAAFLAAALPWQHFGDREFGEVVTDHASSWVRRVRAGPGTFYVKTYDYTTWGSQWRSLWRYVGPWARSRARREFDALTWLGKNSPDAPFAVTPVAVFETRRHGLLRRAVLVTVGAGGERVDHVLGRLDAAGRAELVEALVAFVTALHHRGARDGNLDPRNLLALRCEDDRWRFAKLDSPRFRLRPPGPGQDRRTQNDWARLLPQLGQFGHLNPAAAADRRR